MRIEEVITEGIFDDENDFLQFQDGASKLILSDDMGTPKYLYRTVSKEEYENIQQTGTIEPSQFFQRIHASAIPESGDSSAYVVLKIEYDPSDGWKPKQASTGIFAVTWNSVSSEKIVDKLNPQRVRGVKYEYSVEEQYRLFQQ